VKVSAKDAHFVIFRGGSRWGFRGGSRWGFSEDGPFWAAMFNFHGDFGKKVGNYHGCPKRTPFLEILHPTPYIPCKKIETVILENLQSH
jgi:hypothetical protein